MSISIVTCIYNQRVEYFEECLESVMDQQGPVEWIIVDDGSDDTNYAAYCNCLKQIDTVHPVTILRLPENVGLSRARNEGIRNANGDWVVVLDSDDRLAPSFVDSLLSLPRTASIACFEVDYFDTETNEHRPISRWRNLYQHFGRTVADPFLWFDFYYHGIIGRKDLIYSIGGYDNTHRVGEDQDILLRACESVDIENVFFIENTGYHYRKNPEGVCATYWREVEHNYSSTMVTAAQRRGGTFTECKFVGKRYLDGAEIDAYAYLYDKRWLDWEDYLSEVSRKA